MKFLLTFSLLTIAVSATKANYFLKDTLLKGDAIDLPYALMTSHLHGDENLGQPDAFLYGTAFSMYSNGSTVIGALTALMSENGGDGTMFFISRAYTIYTAPPGYTIVSVSVPGRSSLMSTFDDVQRHYGDQLKKVAEGPLKQVSWIGDTGSDQDQIHGVRVKPYLEDLLVTLKKIP